VTALPYSRYSTLPNLRKIAAHEVFARDTPDDRHNFHPRLPASAFDRNDPRMLVKVER
jgi:hypothetical protein